MKIKISPAVHGAPASGYHVYVHGWSTGATYKTYAGAVRVANVIVDEAFIADGIVTLDYSECVAPA